MRDSALDVVSIAEGRSRENLNSDRQLVLALSHAIQIIGEAANQVSETTCESMPDVPWRLIINMRHRIVHDYYRINLDVLWRTVEEEVPDLIARIEPLLPPETD
jgi:uncharacterized protein with HEPN domain